MNYPTEEYESYADCDDHFVRSFLPPGLKPFWTVDNITHATDIFTLDYEFASKLYTHLGAILHIIRNKQLVLLIGDLFYGFKVSDCLLPCLRTVGTVEDGSITEGEGPLLISLSFNDKVKVMRTSVDKFSFMDSLNFFGSNLGLWPGLGLYQIIEWMLGIFLVSQIVKKIRNSFLEKIF